MREAWLAHRRSLVNRALHEARRPLQAIALSLPAGPGRMTPALPVWQAIRALGEVDRQINGGPPDGLAAGTDRLPADDRGLRQALAVAGPNVRGRDRVPLDRPRGPGDR